MPNLEDLGIISDGNPETAHACLNSINGILRKLAEIIALPDHDDAEAELVETATNSLIELGAALTVEAYGESQ